MFWRRKQKHSPSLFPEQKANELLTSCLSQSQRLQYLAGGWFEVTGSAGGRYRIYCNARSTNVTALTGHNRGRRLCALPRDGYTLPNADIWLAQKLAIESDEPGFLKVAVGSQEQQQAALAAYRSSMRRGMGLRD
jgi:hypothetical protein